MMRRRTGADEALVRAASVRVGIQLAAACALAVLIVAVLVFVLGRHLHRPEGLPPDGDGDLDDKLLLVAVLVSGLVGIVLAGAAGWFAARRAVRPLGDALRLQRRFVADAGHELRTPLTILHTRAQLLDRKLAADHPGKMLSRQLLDDSRVLAEIIDELLSSAQLGAGVVPSEPVHLDQFVDDVIATMEPLAERRRVRLVGATESGLVVLGTPSALRRAALALTDNALAHTPPDGEVRVVVRRRGRQALLEVIDNGSGIDTASVPRLSERFARGYDGAGDVGTTSARRLGLGLALVREVVDAHRGDFSIAGQAGRGTIASIALPLAPSAIPSSRSAGMENRSCR